ncbi:Elongation Factor 1-Alpha 1 [Manis pentadactyla]|nr:Elongation Factor 1-Alpha 1 [Manis pentadactyla]
MVGYSGRKSGSGDPQKYRLLIASQHQGIYQQIRDGLRRSSSQSKTLQTQLLSFAEMREKVERRKENKRQDGEEQKYWRALVHWCISVTHLLKTLTSLEREEEKICYPVRRKTM